MNKTRLAKEKPISNDLFKVKLGTINRKNPEVIYINGGTFIKPKEYKKDYLEDIRLLSKNFRKYVKNEVLNNDYFHNEFLSNFEIKLSGIHPEKKTYISFEIHIKQKPPVENINMIENVTIDITNNIINRIADDLCDLDYDITKNKK